MYGGAQVGRREVVPEWEAQELLRLALIVRADCAIDLGAPDARRAIQGLFGALAHVERVGRRLRDQALTRLLVDIADESGPVRSVRDLAELAGVPPQYVRELSGRRDAAWDPDDPGADDSGG